MGRALKFLLFALIVTALVWACTLAYWTVTDHEVSELDIALYLLLLPLLVIGGYFLLRWSIERFRARSGAGAGEAPAGVTPAPAPPSVDETERRLTFEVLAASMRVPPGTSPSAVWTALADGGQRPGLDAELRDDDGAPVFAARVEDVDVETMGETLTGLRPGLEAEHPEWRGVESRAATLRAAALLAQALVPLRAAVESHAARLEPPRPARPTLDPVRPRITPEHLPRLRVLAALGNSWPELDRALLAAVVTQQALDLGVPPAQVVVQTIEVASAEEFAAQLDQKLVALAREKRADLVIALAADSFIDASITADLQARGRLFSGRNVKAGVIAGEGAAALLLAARPAEVAQAAESPVRSDLPPRLHRLALVRRDKSADADGRISGEGLIAAAGQSLAASGLAPNDVEVVVGDVDQRTSRTGEFFGALMKALPDFDVSAGFRSLGTASGELGLARLLACVALAVNQVQEQKKPALVLSVGDAFERAAWAVVPAPPPAPAQS